MSEFLAEMAKLLRMNQDFLVRSAEAESIQRVRGRMTSGENRPGIQQVTESPYDMLLKAALEMPPEEGAKFLSSTIIVGIDGSGCPDQNREIFRRELEQTVLLLKQLVKEK